MYICIHTYIHTTTLTSSGLQPCEQCAPGKFAPTVGFQNCLSCPPGTYSGITGATTCSTCPDVTTTNRSGAVSLSDCLSVEKCPKGSYSFGGIVPCKPCPNNTYAKTNGTRVCTPCPPGYITRGTGWTGEGRLTCIDGSRLDMAFEVCLCVCECVCVCVCVHVYA
jgi:hypothetical protein